PRPAKARCGRGDDARGHGDRAAAGGAREPESGRSARGRRAAATCGRRTGRASARHAPCSDGRTAEEGGRSSRGGRAPAFQAPQCRSSRALTASSATLGARTMSRRSLALCAVLLVSSTAGAAWAQQDPGAARENLKQGYALKIAGKCAEALPFF